MVSRDPELGMVSPDPELGMVSPDLVSPDPTIDTVFRICDALDVSAVTIIKKVDAARKRRRD
jgi:hypothetical protein